MTVYLNPSFAVNAKLSSAARKLVDAIAEMRAAEIPMQSILNTGGYNSNKIEDAAANPLIRTGGSGTGAAVADSVTAILAALDVAGVKAAIANLYQGD